MATINATINVASADLTSSPLALSKTMTMTKAGTTTGLEFTSGLAIGDAAADTADELLATGGNSKITLGKLFGGDWMLIPFQGSANNDIIVTPSTAEATTIEWMLFFE